MSLILTTILAIIAIAAGDREITYKTKRYLLTPRDMTVIENRALCQSRGMNLAFIRDEAENNFIKSHVVNYLRLGAVWNRTQKTFEWEDGSPMTYTNWNSGSTCGEANYCCTVEMVASGKWNVYTCGSQAHALCEHDGEKIPDAMNAINESLVALKEETDLKIINLVVKLDEWTSNITGHVEEIVKEGVGEIVRNEVVKLLNDSSSKENVAKINEKLLKVEANLTKLYQDRVSVEDQLKEDVKSVRDSIEAINLSRNQLKNEVMNEIQDELNTIRNASNHLVFDDSRMINMINQLESEKDSMSYKLTDTENSVENLRKRIFISLTITILLLVAFIIIIGYKYYYERKPILYGFSKHESSGTRSDVDSVQEEYV